MSRFFSIDMHRLWDNFFSNLFLLLSFRTFFIMLAASIKVSFVFETTFSFCRFKRFEYVNDFKITKSLFLIFM